MVKVNGSRFAAEVVRGNARVNLSQMAKPFGKRVRDWLRTDEAQEYLYAISDAQKCASADLLEVRKGGDPLEQGTWCRDYRIALRFAQWLSPEFSIKVDEAILGLLTASRGQARPAPNGPAGTGCDRGASAPGGLLLRGRVYPKDRSAELGAFYAELRKWVLKEDEAAVAELAGVSPGHVAEVLAGRKPGYGVLCLLVEYATENRAAGRQRVVRSAARRAEQVEELRLDFMAGSACSERAQAPTNSQQAPRVRPAANGPTVAGCDRGAMGASADKLTSMGDAMNRVSTAKAQDVTDGIIDFNGMEG